MAESSKQENKAGKKDKAQNSSFSPQDMFKNFTSNMPKVDREQILKSHRKNLEALSEAQKMAFEVIKNIAQLQAQFVRQTFEEMNESMREVIHNPTSREKLSAHVDTVKKSMSKAIDHHSNLSDILLKSNLDVYKLVQERFKDHADSLKKTASH